VIPFLLALAVSLFLTWWMASGRSRLSIMDHPNERSLHAKPVPRSGGVAILVGVLVGWVWLSVKHGLPTPLLWIVSAAMVVAGISLLDDIFELSARVRLPVHMLAALLVLFGGVSLPWGWLGWLMTLFGIVWMLNLYNFMDGMDGFAGGMTLFGFAFLGLGGHLSGSPLFALLCWSVSAASAGFLLFNFPPARIFMGDAGSATLGLLAAALSFWGVYQTIFPLWFPLMVFSPFWIDATVTLIRRSCRREKVWQAHREHYYQRLVRSGWSHRKTVTVEYLLMLAVGASALLLLVYPRWWIDGLLVWGGIYLILARMVDLFFARRQGG